MMLFVMLLLFTVFCRWMPLLLLVPFVVMVFPEIVLSRLVIRKMPWLLVNVPSVVMVFAKMVLLFALVLNSMPRLVLVPFVVMMFSEIVLP